MINHTDINEVETEEERVERVAEDSESHICSHRAPVNTKSRMHAHQYVCCITAAHAHAR